MLTRIRKAQENNEGGFTLIELLVVMIIIGILAAIAIPAFLSQRAKAQDSAAKADVSTLGKELATYYVDGTGTAVVAIASGQYTVASVNAGRPSSNVTLNSSIVAGTTTSATTVTVGATGLTDYCVAVTNPKGSVKNFKYSSANGLEAGQCTSATAP